MPTIGVLTMELRIEHAHSLKDKRHVVKGLVERLRNRFNVAAAEIDHQDVWQRSVVAAVTVANQQSHVEEVLQAVEREAAGWLGPALVSANRELL